MKRVEIDGHIGRNNLPFATFDEYVTRQEEDGVWAELPEVMCMADYLRQEIHVYVTDNG